MIHTDKHKNVTNPKQSMALKLASNSTWNYVNVRLFIAVSLTLQNISWQKLDNVSQGCREWDSVNGIISCHLLSQIVNTWMSISKCSYFYMHSLLQRDFFFQVKEHLRLFIFCVYSKSLTSIYVQEAVTQLPKEAKEITQN